MKDHFVLNKVWAFFEDVEAKGGQLIKMLDFWFKNCFFASNFTFYGVKSGLFKIKKVHPQNEIIR